MAKYALLFPGQGSQSVGMLQDISEQHTEIKSTYEEASSVLGYDLWQMVSEGPQEKLNQTIHTQPAMLAGDVAVLRVWQKLYDGKPHAVAGHSLGEYGALVAADVLSFADAVRLVAERARLMQEAVPEGVGAVAAVIGLDDDGVASLCDDAREGEVLDAVNYNSPGQTVIAGHATAVTRALGMAKEKGAKLAKLLPLSVPVHCELMQPAADAFGEVLASATFNTPSTIVINNVDVAICDEPSEIQSALARQIASPVRWVETIEKMLGLGIDTYLESGPAKVLAGLNKRINKEVTTVALGDLQGLEKARALF